MSWMSLILLAVALAMDAFTVALVTGLTQPVLTGRQVLRMSLSFGLFQAFMPLVGWAAGKAAHSYIEAFDHWVAFGLLAFVGARMMLGALGDAGQEDGSRDRTAGWELLTLSVATSIDALAVGLSLALVGSGILLPALVIGLVAASLTALGMLLGGRIGALWGKSFEFAGGLILVGIGIKIVLEHTS